MSAERAFAVPNIRRFTRFRVLFNARYYYPVFTILFLDFGLSLEDFALLNVVWALTIAVAEVPSGALADLIGRRNLLLSGSILMCLEMLVLLLAPVGGGGLTFALFALNRVFSGLAEAMVSGADEALAFEALEAENLESHWSAVLERVGKRMSLVMASVMVAGAFLYDAHLLNTVLGAIHSGWNLPVAWIHRIPIALTLVHALVVLVTAWLMTEPGDARAHFSARQIGQSFQGIWSAVLWLGSHCFILFVILGGLILDSTARQFVILSSEYFRNIRIPEAAFGFISAGLAAFGYVTARFSRRLAERYSPFYNLLILSGILVGALVGLALALPWVGLVFVPLTFLMFGAVNFLQSQYINREVDSRQRATLLSFRGLANNLGMGLASLLYATLVAQLRENAAPELSGEALERSVFVDALGWFPGYYLALLAFLLIAGRLLIRRRELCFAVPQSRSSTPSK